jgi:ankyrin repeat protein
MNLFQVFDASGYSPVHYAAFKNQERAMEVLIQYVLNDPNLVPDP